MSAEDANWEGEGSGAEYDPLAHPSVDHNQSVGESADASDAASDGDGEIEENDEDEDQDDGGEYDPESIAFDDTPQIPDKLASETPSQRPTNKPKMSGGFLVEVSDDEEDDSNDLLATDQSRSGARSGPTSNGAAPFPTSDALPNGLSAMPGVDPVMLFEARIQEDPRGDMDAWISLMASHKRRSRLDDLRLVYNRFLEVFPQAGDIWVEWIEMELNLDNFVDAEQLFGRCLMTVPNVKLWTVYLNYIRRRNDLTNDPTGQARRTVTQSYEFVIDNIGVDRDSGSIWQDYVHFIKNGPGQVGGTGWQDQQKMDQLRKAYHRAIAVPMSTVNTLWKEYDQFEMGLNKVTGRKFIQERSPGYMSAKSANIALDNITRNLKRTNLPRLPPAPGFDGHEEYHAQVEAWKKWIAWEKEDPLVLKDDEPKVYKQRILYCYKQALMALRFWPETWVDAAAWCFENDVRENEKVLGIEMLHQGIAANPESVLLAFKHADHIEANYPEKDVDKSEYAKNVRKPYDSVLEALYKMGDKVKEREKLEINTIKQAAAHEPPVQDSIEPLEDDDEEDQIVKKSPTEERIAAIQQAYAAETQLLSKTISYIWIAMARAMRRIQGKGNQTEGGLRKVFTDARQKGRLTSDVYVAVALLESVVYKDPVGAKIFERGARLFPNDESFMIEYLKYLHSKDDTTNARVVFETCVNRLVSKPETLHKARPLYAYFHKYESQYGELSQISKLEARMVELFPNDPKLKYFTSRYSSDSFDPVAAPIIISKAVQMRPRQLLPAMEQPVSVRGSIPPPRHEHSPRPQFIRATVSPKRPFGIDDDELNPPKRLARGVSPLKGAAGRRLDQQRRNQTSALHRDITFLLGILPPSHTYDAHKLNSAAMTTLLRDTQLPDYASWKAKTGGQYLFTAPTNNRPISPYGRMASATGYRNSPLRTESSSVYATNPYAPPDATAAALSWQPPASSGYGVPPPAGQFGGYRF